MIPIPDRSEIERFRAMMSLRFGHHYDDDKLDLLAEVLRRRLEATRCARFEAYVERIGPSARGSTELKILADQLTINETFFFRDTDSFRAFSDRVLSARVRARAQEKRLRILSAGCASGEEPYSLAIAVREALPDFARWDVTIVGLDLSPAMLARAAEARYSAWSLRSTPDELKRRYFQAEGREFVLDPEVRRMVRFEEGNLVDEDPRLWQRERYDVVFGRNVLMYFTAEVMRSVVRRVGHALLPGGFFFLGHAETLRGLSQGFHLCHTHDTFYYQKREDVSSRWDEAQAVTPRDVAAEALPAVVEASTSWVEAIRQASERIAELARDPSRKRGDPADAPCSAAPPAPRPWDLGLVLEAVQKERFAEALDLLAALPAESGAAPDALLLRAVLLINSGRREEAEEACARLLGLDDLNAGAHHVMALCREYAGDTAGAIEHDQSAVYLDAGFAMPHLHMGLMARRAGDAEGATRSLSQARILLAREDASRLLLFGGGFSREALLSLCAAELRVDGGDR